MKRNRTPDAGLVAAGLLFALTLALPGCGARGQEAAAPVVKPAGPSAAWLMDEGRGAAARGDTVRAEQYIVMAIDRGYDERRALPLLLAVCIKGSRLRSALNHAEPYLRDHPNDAPLRYLVATIEAGLGDEEGARRELEALLRDSPGHAEATFLLGVLELDHDPDTAAERLLDYLRLEPSGRHAADARVRLRELARQREEDARLLGLVPLASDVGRALPGAEGREP